VVTQVLEPPATRGTVGLVLLVTVGTLAYLDTAVTLEFLATPVIVEPEHLDTADTLVPGDLRGPLALQGTAGILGLVRLATQATVAQGHRVIPATQDLVSVVTLGTAAVAPLATLGIVV
jgi:hypothetical protein